jgi:hypothetical protein
VKKTEKKTNKPRPVLVCTEYRGVFYGHTDAALTATEAVLTGVRNCLSWDTATGGVFGLAANGPSKGCRVGAKVVGAQGIQKITYMAEMSPEAAKAWESAPCVS